MKTLDQMKQEVSKYQMWFDQNDKKVFITKGSGQTTWVKVSYKRALQWVEVGIDDLDCRSKEEMIELINSWEGK